MNRFAHAPPRAVRWPLLALLLLAALLGSTAPGGAATSNTTVGATVISQTTLVPDSCEPGMTDRTDLGPIVPTTDAIGELGCQLVFGSSNDTGRLIMHQTDRRGAAMYHGYTADPDPSFGTDGFLTESVSAGSDRYVDVLRLSAARGYLVLGYSNTADDDVIVEHRDLGWQLVTGWGTLGTGRSIIDAGTTPRPRKLHEDGAGRIIVTGSDNNNPLAIRLLADGTLDASFASGGVFTTGAARSSHINAAVLTDDRILFATSEDGGDGRDIFTLTLDSDGDLDTSVGGGDGISAMWGSGLNHDDVFDVEPLDDGGALVTFSVQGCGSNARLVRIDDVGEIDTSWANGGQTDDTYPQCATRPSDLIIKSDGTVIMGGHTNDTPRWWIARRTIADGELDPSFNSVGYNAGNLGGNNHDDARLMLTDEQTISLVFRTGTTFYAVRTSPDGIRDSHTGSPSGVTTRTHPTATAVTFGAITPGPDGSAYVVGSATIGGNQQLMTLHLPGVPVPNYGTAPDRRFGSTTSDAFGACLLALTDGTGGAAWGAPRGVGGCTAADDPGWHPIAEDALDAEALVATATANVNTAAATIRFGFHTLSSTRAGYHWAPVTLSVLAP